MKHSLYLLFISLCAHSCLLGNDGTAVHTNFEHARQQLADMLNSKTPLSYERAVFITENAYWDNELSEAEFTNVLNLHTAYIQQLYRANHQKSLADFKPTLLKTAAQQLQQYEQALVNYAIYLYMTDTTYYIDSAHISYHLPNTYSQTDPLGTLNFSNTQVHSLLYSPAQQGNCYAQAALFKIYSDRLQSKAALCTAPGHIYISHTDADGVQYNIEPATGSFPGAGTLATLTYSTTDAIKSNIAMRQLDTKQAIALCLVYLAKGYEHKTGERASAFALQCAELALQHDNLCLNAMLLQAEVMEAQLMAQNKTVVQLQGDATFTAYQNLLRSMYAKGYRQMPAAQRQLIMDKIRGEDVAWASISHTGRNETPKASLSSGVLDEEMQTKPVEIYSNTAFNTKTQTIEKFVIANEEEYPIDLVTFALSVDPLAAKYASMSPYAAFADNPIIYVDADGRENIIYLIVLPSDKSAVKVSDATAIANQANENFKALGVKTEVRVISSANFDISKIDKTDAVAVVGEKTQVATYVKNTLGDKEFGAVLETDWVKERNNPEKSENLKNSNPANIIAVDANALSSFGDELGLANDKDKNIKAGALSINHGAGHNSSLNHSDSEYTSDNDAPVMRTANGIAKYSKNNGYKNIFDRQKNADYTKRMKTRFSDNTPTDNYSKRITKKQ